MKTLLEKYDTTFSKLHGGGNGRRLVESFRDNIASQDTYNKRLVNQAKEIMAMREAFDLLPEHDKEYQRKFAENKSRDMIEHLLGYILALDEAE